MFLEDLEVVGDVLVVLRAFVELRLGHAIDDAPLFPFVDPLHDALPLRGLASQHRGKALMPHQEIIFGSIELREGFHILLE